MDKIDAMRIFREISYTLSLTKTAENLKLTRSYVTRSVNLLEEWLDTKLLQRSTRHIYLTRDGEKFLSHFNHIIDYMEKIQEQQREKNQRFTGSITVTGAIAFSQRFLSPVIAEFTHKYPELSINLIADDAIRDLGEDRIDLAIRVTNCPEESLIGKKLCQFPSLLVSTPDYLFRHGRITHPGDLIDHRCVCYTSQTKWHFYKNAKETAVTPAVSFKSNESGTLLSYALAGGGVALLPGFLVEKYLKTGQLVTIMPDWETTSLSVYALYLAGRRTHPAIKILTDFIAEEMQKMACENSAADIEI